MNEIRIFRGSKHLYTFKSGLVPPVGEFIWLNGSKEYLEVESHVYDLNTWEGNLIINVMVK